MTETMRDLLHAVSNDLTEVSRSYLDPESTSAAKNSALLLTSFAKRNELPEADVIATFVGVAHKLLSRSSVRH
ncbi:hypothetical protein [Neorhizobium sp. S3-V5DH]|uniref:hypothetical protein n=1 Tax=Neorhizobium sp. S3-V5DH TaxID=2485166 RepID=UPI0010499C46|nr:hypothetical protein [Neorhizobium sp. S3-V5DH]TCV67491.1 hypothetical protein EDE09_113152 [Neorhizobium sp. S3-V5DH]